MARTPRRRRPDPAAAIPAGDWLQVQAAPPSAPAAPGTQSGQDRADAVLSGRKPLRKPKGLASRATRIDIHADLARGQGLPATIYALRAPAPHAAAAPAAPAPAAATAPWAIVGTFRIGQDDNTSIPPDTHAAVGLAHVLAAHNNDVSIFDLAGVLISRTSLNSFWSGVGLNGHTFDPKVVYDRAADRFYFVTMADAEEATSRLLIACSETGDPTAMWRSYTIQVDQTAQGKVWMDYPSLGFSDDKITVSVNLFTLQSNAFAGVTVYAFDKPAFLNAAAQISVQRFVLMNMGATHAPAIATGPGFADQFIVATWSGNAGGKGYLLVLRLAGSVAAGTATLTRIGYLPCSTTWDSFPPVPDIGPQQGTQVRMSVGDDRMQTVSLHNGVLYCCHTVMLPAGNPTVSAIQWWEVPIQTWAASVSRLTDPEGGCLAHPSLAVNDQGDKLVGLSVFSSAHHPSGGYCCLPAAAAPSAPAIFALGTATYHKTFGGGQNRWGDYSATMTDPRTGLDFWTAQTHSEPWLPALNEQGRWATMIARVRR